MQEVATENGWKERLASDPPVVETCEKVKEGTEQRRPVRTFDGPVTALSSWRDETCVTFCFCTGNQVFLHTESSGCGQPIFAPVFPPAERPRPIVALPAGAVITAVAHCRAWAVLGAGDRLFAVDLYQKTLHHLVVAPRGRIMAVTYDMAGTFLAVTSQNALFAVEDWQLTGATRNTAGASPVCIPGPPMGIVLAADAVVLSRGQYAVFSGSYGGVVSIWTAARLSSQSDPAGCAPSTMISQVAAHTSNCAALFSVRAVAAVPSGPAGDEVPRFAVATCSDDRSAAVFSAASLAGPWRCQARHQGRDFATTRVLGVDLVAVTPSDGDGESMALYYAAATEDGGVFVFSTGLSPSTPPLFVRRGLHGRRAVVGVSLVVSSSRQLLVASSGVDGSVVVSTVSSSAATCGSSVVDTWQPPRPSATATPSEICTSETPTQKGSVRCVFAEPSTGTTYFCLGTELYRSEVVSTGRPLVDNSPVLVASWTRDTEEAANPKALLPVALHVVSGDAAFIGTEGGHLIAVTLSTAPSHVILPVWAAHKKVLLLQSMRLRTDLMSTAPLIFQLVSAHATGGVLVTLVDLLPHSAGTSAAIVTRLCGLEGLMASSLSMWERIAVDSPIPGLEVAVGDKNGIVRSYTFMPGTDCGPETAARWTGRVFVSPIHTLHQFPVGSPSVSETELLMVTSDNASFAFVNVRLPVADAPVLCSFPLRFPLEATRVLAAGPGVCITLTGSSVSVYHSAPRDLLWTRTAEFHNVKARRLVHASVHGAAAYLTHCPDGRHVETFSSYCDASFDPSVMAPELSSHSSSRVVVKGPTTGKNINCAVVLRSSRMLVYGSEDSSISFGVLSGSCERAWPQMVAHGGHKSNILAICEVDTRAGSDSSLFVTVGGLSTVTLWHWSRGWQLRILDSLELRTGCPGASSGGPAAVFTDDVSEERVPRFLSVVAPTCNTLVIGSSDATLRILRICPAHDSGPEGAESIFLQLRLRQLGVSHVLLNPARPKPIFSLCAFETDGRASPDDVLLCAGDTNGVVYIARLRLRAVGRGEPEVHHHLVAQLRVEQSCVNAMTTVSRVNSAGSHLFATLHDSGALHLLSFTEAGAGGASSLQILSSVSTGLTAGRGVAWAPKPATGPSSEELIVVNEERLIHFSVGANSQLESLRASRVTVRCVSGLAVGGAHPVVVGHGAEEIVFPSELPMDVE